MFGIQRLGSRKGITLGDPCIICDGAKNWGNKVIEGEEWMPQAPLHM